MKDEKFNSSHILENLLDKLAQLTIILNKQEKEIDDLRVIVNNNTSVFNDKIENLKRKNKKLKKNIKSVKNKLN